MKRRYVIVIAIALTVMCFIGYRILEKVEIQRKISTLDDHVHYICKIIEVYRNENGEFPDSIEIALHSQKNDLSAMQSLYGESMEYVKPLTHSGVTTAVLTVKYGEYRIVMQKSFLLTNYWLK
jgi:hypothetical protein